MMVHIDIYAFQSWFRHRLTYSQNNTDIQFYVPPSRSEISLLDPWNKRGAPLCGKVVARVFVVREEEAESRGGTNREREERRRVRTRTGDGTLRRNA